jgi:diketogulonate reductase-like aldo/keto reductase
METTVLNNGVEIPLLGFGVYRINDLAQCEQCVCDALETGYRLIDTALIYGNEEAVGRAIKRSGTPREELFITTKVWPNRYGREKTTAAVEESLGKLGLDYIDLYLLHAPYNDCYGAWHVLEGFYREGRIRAIGVSNFGGERLVDLILNNEVAPTVNQVELNLFRQQKELRDVMAEYGVQPEAWRPLGDGAKEALTNEALVRVATKHGRTAAQVMLRWQIQNGIVAIPKSIHKERIAENFAIWDFRLDEDDLSALATLDTIRDGDVSDAHGAVIAKGWNTF